MRIFGYTFKSKDLFRKAVTHASLCEESIAPQERLEFLGDAIIDAVVSCYLYQKMPHVDEGGLTELRASVVSTRGLANAARAHQLEEFVEAAGRLMRAGYAQRDRTLANTLEAIVGAIHLEGGYDVATKAVFIALGLEELSFDSAPKNTKGRLQELLQSHFKLLPEYQGGHVAGPNHAPIFEAKLYFQGRYLASAQGRTQKSAEQAAALVVLERIEKLSSKELVAWCESLSED